MSVIEPNLRKGTCVRARRAVLLAAAISVVIAVVAVSGGTAGAARGCGYIRVPGAIVNVHVRGAVSCRTARSVMTRYWAGHGRCHARRPYARSFTAVSGWRCPNVGSGMSSCQRGRARITGTYALGKVS
jgi:hypothetical protein